MRVAVAVVLSAEDREQLETLSRGRKVAARVVERARIILLASEGKQNQEIAQICRMTRRTVGVWRRRFAEMGIDGILKDAPRTRRRRTLSEEVIREIVRKTTQETPPARTHWSTRSLAKAMGLSPSTIGRVWRSHGLKPHLTRRVSRRLGAGHRSGSRQASPEFIPSQRLELGFDDVPTLSTRSQRFTSFVFPAHT